MTDNIKLPFLPEPRKPDEHGAGWFTAGQMQAYAREAVRLNAAPVPDGMVLVPKRMTQAMRDVTDTEGWAWEDLLSAAESVTEAEYNALAAAPEPQGVPEPADDEAPTADELEAFRRKHWQHWTASENLLIAHLVQTLRAAQQSGAAQPEQERKPITGVELDDVMRAEGYFARNKHFMQGFRAAERHHGITKESL